MPRPVPNTQTGSLTDNQHGTNDTLILGTGTGPFDLQIALHGDALAMYDDARGGNDTLIGGATCEQQPLRRRPSHVRQCPTAAMTR